MKCKYEAIIFDFDGVLVDSVDIKTKAFAKLYAEYGDAIVKQVVSYHLENGGLSRFEKFRYFHLKFLGKNLSSEDEVTLGNQFEELVFEAVISASWCSGAYEFLEKFSKNIPFFIASGTPEYELKKIIEQRNMSHYFVSVHGSPETKTGNIKKILRQNNMDQMKVLMIGDSINDYLGASEAGVDFVGFSGSQESVFPCNAKIISNIMELQNLV